MRSVVDLVCAAFRALIRDRRGTTAIEYAMILALIFLAMVSSVAGVGGSTSNLWYSVSSKIQAARS